MSARLVDRYSKSCSCENLVAFWTARLLLESAVYAAVVLEDERIGVHGPIRPQWEASLASRYAATCMLEVEEF
jgi:hypothetical protein